MGCLLTNYHVIRPAVEADIVLLNGDKGTIWKVLAEDEKTDLALLTVHVQSRQPLKPIYFGSDDPCILSTVFAIGSPKGLQGSASEGQISGYREIFGDDRWLQTTTPITRDVTSMTATAYGRVERAVPMPGLIVVPHRMAIGRAVDELIFLAKESASEEWERRVIWLPL